MGDLRPAALNSNQHGPMEGSEPPAGVDLARMREYRLKRLVEQIEKNKLCGMLLVDPLNVRYATDSTNQQIWSMHNETRCVFIGPKGEIVLYDYADLPQMTGDVGFSRREVMSVFYYFAAGANANRAAEKFAEQIFAAIKDCSNADLPLAVDRVSLLGIEALKHLRDDKGLELVDAWQFTELARCIKSPDEIILMRHAIDIAKRGCDAMHALLERSAEITENELWAELHKVNIVNGGEWIEARLLSSGPRTNPWMQECSMRKIQMGDMVAFDTDMIGPYGFCADISRSWVRGGNPTPLQEDLHHTAIEQISHNIKLLAPGIEFLELARMSWPIQNKYKKNRYSCLAHGVGLCDEYPSIPYLDDLQDPKIAPTLYNGILEEGMVLCIESLIGEEKNEGDTSDPREAVKLEEQVLITRNGYEVLSTNIPLGLNYR